MKILSPLDNKEEVEALVKAGADEFYCGILSEEWRNKYGAVASQNRREWENNSFHNFKDFAEAIRKVHLHEKKIFLTVNAHFYTNEQYPLLLEEIKKAIALGIDGFIIADLALMLKLKEEGIKTDLIMSTGAVIINTESARFYKELGATHITFPRHVTIDEISKITKDCPDIKFHAFILNEGCFNLDGFCTFHHGTNSKNWEERILACSLPYEVSIQERVIPSKERNIKYRLKNVTNNLLINCGACAIYDFNLAGVHSIKIVGRGNPKEKKIRDIRFMKQLVDLAPNCANKSEFVEIAKSAYEKTYKRRCTFRNCYY